MPHVGNMQPVAARNESDRIIGTNGWFRIKVHDIFRQKGGERYKAVGCKRVLMKQARAMAANEQKLACGCESGMLQ